MADKDKTSRRCWLDSVRPCDEQCVAYVTKRSHQCGVIARIDQIITGLTGLGRLGAKSVGFPV